MVPAAWVLWEARSLQVLVSLAVPIGWVVWQICQALQLLMVGGLLSYAGQAVDLVLGARLLL